MVDTCTYSVSYLLAENVFSWLQAKWLLLTCLYRGYWNRDIASRDAFQLVLGCCMIYLFNTFNKWSFFLVYCLHLSSSFSILVSKKHFCLMLSPRYILQQTGLYSWIYSRNNFLINLIHLMWNNIAFLGRTVSHSWGKGESQLFQILGWIVFSSVIAIYSVKYVWLCLQSRSGIIALFREKFTNLWDDAS